MRSKLVLLSVPPVLYTVITQRAKAQYMTPQEYFIDLARKELLRQAKTAVAKPAKQKIRTFEDLFIKKRR